MACKPGSVRAGCPACDGHSSGTPVARRLKQPTRTAMRKRIPGRLPAPVPSLFGFAPGGVYLANAVASAAVRSYRTLSPLLPWACRAPRTLRPAGQRCAASGPEKRFAFCGTFPGVAPAGRYPAPCFRGARTFLHLRWRASTANGHSARLPSSGHPANWHFM